MHGKIPQECMQTVIVPICKNKNENISDAGNYRPVSLATIISKLFEHYLSCISLLLATTDNQFGFKPKHGTDMCILLLKQTVSYYVTKDSPVFSAFLDASKAFDRTNHNLLFAKLIKRNVPMCIVTLFIVELVQATDHASKMGYQLLIPFTVTNGVRQGGVLSPYLFAVYLDELSIQVGSARVGCTVGNMVVNHLMFADDMCVQPQYSWATMSSEYLW